MPGETNDAALLMVLNGVIYRFPDNVCKGEAARRIVRQVHTQKRGIFPGHIVYGVQLRAVKAVRCELAGERIFPIAVAQKTVQRFRLLVGAGI